MKFELWKEKMREQLAKKPDRKCGRCGKPCDLWNCDECAKLAVSEALSDPTRYA
jgi:hypothetical protein